MSKTTNHNTIRSLPGWMLIILAIQINSLVVHFLLEDPIFLAGESETISSINYSDELNHQDDLTHTGSSPARIPNSQPDFIFSVSLLTHDQAVFSHFNPPR